MRHSVGESLRDPLFAREAERDPSSKPLRECPSEHDSPKSSTVALVGVAIGLLLRCFLVASGLTPTLETRIEIVTPMNSWQRLKHGHWLMQRGLSPYSGSFCQTSPLLLYFLGPLDNNDYVVPYLLALVELASAMVLHQLIYRSEISRTGATPGSRGLQAGVASGPAGSQAEVPPRNLAKTQSSAAPSPLSECASAAASLAMLLLLLNPLRVVSSTGATTDPFRDLLVLSSLLAAVSGNAPMAAFGWLMSTHLSLNSAVLAVPICLMLASSICYSTSDLGVQSRTESTSASPSPREAGHSETPTAGSQAPNHQIAASDEKNVCGPIVGGSRKQQNGKESRSGRVFFVLYTALQFAFWSLLWLGFLLLLSSAILKCTLPEAAQVLFSRHAFEYNTEDLTPNLGLRWYFFSEVFPEARSFFSFVFTGCLLLLLLPLTIRLHHRPLFLAFTLMQSTNLLGAYPSVSDYGLTMSLLPLFLHELAELRAGFVVLLGLLYAVTMGPIMFDLWCAEGIGNANFYYAVTLVFALSQGTFLVQSVWAVVSYDNKVAPGI